VTGWTLVRTHHAVARRFVETLARVGLNPTQFGVLVQVVSDPGLSQAELARRVLVTPQSIGELLTSLEHLGHITRRRGPRGKASVVRVTDSGRSALDRATPLVQAMNSPQALGLTPDEDTTLNALLHKVLAAMNDS
jgi:DNA-binding MarR family transcriptional regulator